MGLTLVIVVRLLQDPAGFLHDQLGVTAQALLTRMADVGATGWPGDRT